MGAMRAAGLDVTGTLDELLAQAGVVVDCTPKRVAPKNMRSEAPHGADRVSGTDKRSTEPPTRSDALHILRVVLPGASQSPIEQPHTPDPNFCTLQAPWPGAQRDSPSH